MRADGLLSINGLAACAQLAPLDATMFVLECMRAAHTLTHIASTAYTRTSTSTHFHSASPSRKERKRKPTHPIHPIRPAHDAYIEVADRAALVPALWAPPLPPAGAVVRVDVSPTGAR